MVPGLTVSLFFGFIAKEMLLGAVAVIYSTSETNLGGLLVNRITPLQVAKSHRFALLSLGWSLLLA